MNDRSTPAGWYPAPDMTGSLRYWDGQKWTEHVVPAAPSAPSQAVAPRIRDHPLTAGQLAGIIAALLVLAVLVFAWVSESQRQDDVHDSFCEIAPDAPDC